MTEGGFSSLSHCTSAAQLHRWAEELMDVRRAGYGAISLFEHDWAPRYFVPPWPQFYLVRRFASTFQHESVFDVP